MNLIGGESVLWRDGIQTGGTRGGRKPPVAGDDAATVISGESTTIAVLSNDADPEGGALTVTSATADQGSAVVNADNTVTYTAPQGFSGVATVTYTIQDPTGKSAQGIVLVTVTANQPPVAGDDIAAVAVSGGSVTVDVLANDVDPEGGALTVTSATADQGSAVVNADNTVTYTAPQDFSGAATVTYTIRDPAGNTDDGTLTITVTPIQLVIDETTEIGNFAVEAQPGTITLTIFEPVEYASEHVIETTDLASGPINLIPSRISGDTTVGGTLIATPGVWACDEVHGTLAFDQTWLRAATPVAGATEATYTVTEDDVTSGLRYRRQARNTAGTRVVEVEALAATEVPSGGFTENGVRFTSGSKLVRNANLAPSDSRDVLFFTSFIPYATGRQSILRQKGNHEGIEIWDGVFLFSISVGGYRRGISSRPLTAGQRTSFLGVATATGETDVTMRLFSRFAGETAWTADDTITETGLLDLTFGMFGVGGRPEGTGHELNAAVYRVACWAGAPLDPEDPLFFARFLKADGTLEDPTVSRDFYGMPTVDLYGPADEYLAGVNRGDAGNFDTIEGTFTNA